jgi:hypothetical protein
MLLSAAYHIVLLFIMHLFVDKLVRVDTPIGLDNGKELRLVDVLRVAFENVGTSYLQPRQNQLLTSLPAHY